MIHCRTRRRGAAIAAAVVPVIFLFNTPNNTQATTGPAPGVEAPQHVIDHAKRSQVSLDTPGGWRGKAKAAKAKAAHETGLKPIVCVGEQLEDRESDRTEEVVGSQIRASLAGLTAGQMEGTVVAYEPVWAIGTGKTATSAQAQEVHAFIRNLLGDIFDEDTAKRVRIQYGGSVKPDNARELMSQPDVDGALVGGASLDVRNFSEIILNSI